MHQIGIEENLTADGYSVGIGNRLDLTDEELLNNMHNVQFHNGLPQTSENDNKYPEFDIARNRSKEDLGAELSEISRDGITSQVQSDLIAATKETEKSFEQEQ